MSPCDTPGDRAQSWRLVALVVVVLSGIDWLGRPWSFRQLYSPPDVSPAFNSFLELVWWSGACLLFYWWVPTVWLKRKGQSWQSMVGRLPSRKGWLVYLGFYIAVLPLILYYFRDPRFVAMYPFYRFSLESPLLALGWELCYGGMFFSLEFFFRGFLIRQLCPRWGWGGIWFSTLPYFLIHYYKPFPEMLGSIPAGLVLGFASWRSGSIWGGLAVHLGVAYTMDLVQILYAAGWIS